MGLHGYYGRSGKVKIKVGRPGCFPFFSHPACCTIFTFCSRVNNLRLDLNINSFHSPSGECFLFTRSPFSQLYVELVGPGRSVPNQITSTALGHMLTVPVNAYSG